ncbi:TIGD6 [Cordylochernes scorpioides]|uniref:TIGD6 n=1 Tax=Cordylochernes scorpioides TaxID=51811 RepID=A0ABY6KPM2_9ARAC|nr:TIGD6 [Cordylochernes scorpioides]
MKIIEEIEQGKSHCQVSRERNIPRSTISTIFKNKFAIKSAFLKSNFSSTLKRDRDGEFPEIEEALIRWIRQANAMKLAINGNILKEKAILLALKMSQDNFEASNGWLEKFKTRRNIAFKRLHGEAGSVDANSVATWKGGIIPSLLAKYTHRTFSMLMKQEEKEFFLLILENCPAHQIPEGLQNIEIIFLPALTTSALQPCDMGIIKALKDQYRKRMITYLLTCMEEKKMLKFVMDEAMEEVVEEEMNRCFEALKKHQAIDVNYIDFLEVDKDVQVAGEQSIEEIVKEVMGKEEDEELVPSDGAWGSTSRELLNHEAKPQDSKPCTVTEPTSHERP